MEGFPFRGAFDILRPLSLESSPPEKQWKKSHMEKDIVVRSQSLRTGGLCAAWSISINSRGQPPPSVRVRPGTPPPPSLFPVPNPIHHGSVWGDVQLPQRQKNGRPLFTPRPCQKALNVFWESRFHFDPSCAAAGSEETSEEKPHFLYRRTNPAMKWTGVISIP